MNRRLREFWDKHESWVAPTAMALFLWAGIKIGSTMATTEQTLICTRTINEMSEQLGAQDDRITAKDRRLRSLENTAAGDHQGIVNAAKSTAEAAAKAAEAAQKSAEAAAAAAEAKTPTEVPASRAE